MHPRRLALPCLSDELGEGRDHAWLEFEQAVNKPDEAEDDPDGRFQLYHIPVKPMILHVFHILYCYL
jgi:hypothetical protein